MFQPAALTQDKFQDPDRTAAGETRARVPLTRLEVLWINTGTLCNIACANCYIESTPYNDRLVYIRRAEVSAYLDEIEALGLGTRTIGFTGGEPFMNPDVLPMLEETLARGYEALVLTNAMRPMMRLAGPLLALKERFAERLTIRVSLDHYGQALHETERGAGTWAPAVEGLSWLGQNGFRIHVAGRQFSGETEEELRAGYARLFEKLGVSIDVQDREALVLFPEMDADVDVPEITTACWGILNVDPAEIMCATSRMVVKRKGAETPSVVSCTLLPYDERFDYGPTLKGALEPISLNHPHCAKFCVLGGASCGG